MRDLGRALFYVGLKVRDRVLDPPAAEARVRQWMTVDPVTIEPETTIEDAARIMFDNNFRHLPVVKDGRPLGIVSLRVLARWAFERSK